MKTASFAQSRETINEISRTVDEQPMNLSLSVYTHTHRPWSTTFAEGYRVG